MRAMLSVALPGGNGTISFTGWVGYAACARGTVGNARVTARLPICRKKERRCMLLPFGLAYGGYFMSVEKGRPEGLTAPRGGSERSEFGGHLVRGRAGLPHQLTHGFVIAHHDALRSITDDHLGSD